MSETNRPEKSDGPALTESVQEVQGRFPNDASLQTALGELSLNGFDHADFSLPDPDSVTPEGADQATDTIDRTQLRTMASGMTSASAASLVAGVMVASGGVALPVVAAAAGLTALGAAGATSGAGAAADAAASEARDRAGAEGRLILAVRTPTPEKMGVAEEVMRKAGATSVTRVTQVEQALTRGVSASSWTGG